MFIWEHTVRFLNMRNEKEVRRRAKALDFWRDHGLLATVDAFGVSRPTLFRWKQALREKRGRLDALDPKSTAPKRRRRREYPLGLLGGRALVVELAVGLKEQLKRVRECDRPGLFLAEGSLGENAPGLFPGLRKLQDRIASDLPALAAGEQHDEGPCAPLGQPESNRRGVVPIGHRALLGRFEALDRHVCETNLWHRFGTDMGRFSTICYVSLCTPNRRKIQ